MTPLYTVLHAVSFQPSMHVYPSAGSFHNYYDYGPHSGFIWMTKWDDHRWVGHLAEPISDAKSRSA